MQASCSSSCGSLFPGGRHLTIFAMYTFSRSSPIDASILSSSFPAGPTNGSPCKSSCCPGPYPTNIISAFRLPTPITTLVLVSQRRHFLQFKQAPSRVSQLFIKDTSYSLGIPASISISFCLRNISSSSSGTIWS